MTRFLSVCVACMTIAACGGGGGGPAKSRSDTSAARHVISQYLEAIKSKDWSTACNDIASATKQKLRIDSGGTSCAEAFAAIDQRDARAAQVFSLLGSATVGNVSTDGDSGVASISLSGRTLKTPLVKEDGVWKVRSGG